MNFKKVYFICILLLFILLKTNSHPHFFVEPKIELILSEKRIDGLKVSWTWDKWWSTDVIDNCDINNDNKFNADEIKLVYKDFFADIKDMNYFTEIYLDKKKIKIENVDNFSATLSANNTVTYEFFIPLNEIIENQSQITIIFNDKTYSMGFDKNTEIMQKNKISDLKIETYNYYGIKISFDVFE